MTQPHRGDRASPLLLLPGESALHLWKVPRRPAADGLEDGMKATSEPGDRVLHPWGNRRVVPALDQAVELEIPELLGEHALAHPGDHPPQLGEAERAPHDQGVDDGRLPLAGDDAHDGLDPFDFIHTAIVPIWHQVTKMCLVDFVYQIPLAFAPLAPQEEPWLPSWSGMIGESSCITGRAIYWSFVGCPPR